MRNLWKSVLGLCAISFGLGMSAPAQADSVGPYYAMPAWDQTLPAATRFIVLSNFAGAAVLDRETGLVWEKSLVTALENRLDVRLRCANRNVGGQKGFRLPSLAELSSLVDPSVADPGPTLPPGHPFQNVQSAVYFTATVDADNPVNMWMVNFQDGSASPLPQNQLPGFRYWCVRGAMNADQY